MFIQTEQTPNPASLKFLPGCEVMGRGVAEFTDKEKAKTSPLAEKLFTIGGVAGVFFGSDFITITKDDKADWITLKTMILGTLMEHFSTGQPVMLNEDGGAEIDENDSDIVKQIKELLETRIRPVVAQDGGDIVFHDFREGVVYLHMRGACAGCPSSTATLKNGIENLLKHFVPEVNEVRAVN
jgi:Fe-S cluster biogenesis protein NfuA